VPLTYAARPAKQGDIHSWSSDAGPGRIERGAPGSIDYRVLTLTEVSLLMCAGET
jgi:hypothetical protein